MIEVFDDFALIIDTDDAVYVAIRPETEGEVAVYAVPPNKAKSTHLLYLYGTPIVSHHISRLEPTFSGRHKLNFIVKENKNSEALLPDSYYLDIDATAKTAHFAKRPIQNAEQTFDISN